MEFHMAELCAHAVWNLHDKFRWLQNRNVVRARWVEGLTTVRVYFSSWNIPDLIPSCLDQFQITHTDDEYGVCGCFFLFQYPSILQLHLNNKQGLRVLECVPADIRLEAGMQPEQASCPSSSTHTRGNLESLMRIRYMLSEITRWNTDFKLNVGWWIVQRFKVIHSQYVLILNVTEEKTVIWYKQQDRMLNNMLEAIPFRVKQVFPLLDTPHCFFLLLWYIMSQCD